MNSIDMVSETRQPLGQLMYEPTLIFTKHLVNSVVSMGLGGDYSTTMTPPHEFLPMSLTQLGMSEPNLVLHHLWVRKRLRTGMEPPGHSLYYEKHGSLCLQAWLNDIPKALRACD